MKKFMEHFDFVSAVALGFFLYFGVIMFDGFDIFYSIILLAFQVLVFFWRMVAGERIGNFGIYASILALGLFTIFGLMPHMLGLGETLLFVFEILGWVFLGLLFATYFPTKVRLWRAQKQLEEIKRRLL